jgi:hypothetical protein
MESNRIKNQALGQIRESRVLAMTASTAMITTLETMQIKPPQMPSNFLTTGRGGFGSVPQSQSKNPAIKVQIAAMNQST